MSYDDSTFEYDFFMESVDSGSSSSDGAWSSSANQSDEDDFKAAFFGNFGSSQTVFYNSTADSGDILPWGVKAVWNGNDYTKDEVDFAPVAQVTDSSYDVGAGISTYLLEGMGLKADGSANKDAQVQKFAIVLDTGVAELTNGDLNVGKFASSKYSGSLSNPTNLGGISSISKKAEAEGKSYYSVSQVLSASFLDYDYDGELYDENPFNDDNKHGTHVAGTIAAKADGKGVVGVAPGAEVISMKVLSGTGGGSFEGVQNAIIQSAEYILNDSYQLKNAAGSVIETFDTSMVTKENTVINMSLGAGTLVQSMIDLIEDYADKGVVFTIAAGNSSMDVDGVTPAAAGSNANVWTTSAVDNKYNNAYFTNYDNDDAGDSKDDSTVSAPGVKVYSYNQGSGGNGMGNLDGTSMAAPAVAGLLLMDPMDIKVDTTGTPKILSSQWYSSTDFEKDDFSSPLSSIGAGTNLDVKSGIQLGEDALPVASAPYADPFALSTLDLIDGTGTVYQPKDPIYEDPEEDDKDDTNNNSPWDGYDPTKNYYKTAGNVSGVNGTYSISTGFGAAQQSSLEATLGLTAGVLDGKLTATTNDQDNTNSDATGLFVKAATNATEGSGVKLTGTAKVGETVGFDYILSSNDYIPYNDFTFLQLKTGNSKSENSSILELSTLGAIGLDVANYGTKTGSYLYTFKEGDFGKDSSGKNLAEGFYDLSVGVSDAVDTWVDTNLMVKAMTTGSGDTGTDKDPDGIYQAGVFMWDKGQGNAAFTGGTLATETKVQSDSELFDWTMTTGAASTSQAIIEAVIGLDDGDLDTSLNGTKAAIDSTEGSSTFATAIAKIGDYVCFDWAFETNDYSPYKDFAWYSVNGEAYSLAALGENVADFGFAEGSVELKLTEQMFDMDSYKQGEGGKLKVGFGVMDALDWAVQSNFEVSGLDLFDGSSYKDEEEDELDDVDGVDGLNLEIFGNFEVYEDGNSSKKVSSASTDKEYLFEEVTKDGEKVIEYNDNSIVLSTGWAQGAKALVDQTKLEFQTGLDSGTLDTNLNGTKSKGVNATSGSALFLEGVAAAGDVISFAYAFESNDYVPYQDFAYFTVNGEAMLLPDAEVTGGSGTNDSGDKTFEYEITADDLGGLIGDFEISIGVINALDNAVASTIELSDFDYKAGEAYDDGKLDDEYDVIDVDMVGDVYGDMDDGFVLSTGGSTVSQGAIEDFMGDGGSFYYGSLDQEMAIESLVTDNVIKSAVNATEGSAVKFSGQADVGDKIGFWYYFETNDYVPFADFSFFSIGDESKVTALAAIGTTGGANGTVGNVENWGYFEDYVEITLTDEMVDNGNFDLTFGVVDALDTAVDSELVVGGLEILSKKDGGYEKGEGDYDSTPKKGKEGEKGGDGSLGGKKPVEEDENIAPSLIGNAFFAEDETVVLSTGGGANSQSTIETVLGIKYGDLDGTLNGTKESTNATEGSAAYATVQVDEGDVINFGYTFGTDDYIPYQDFSFVSINGKVANLATVGVECPDYSEISDVFNYVVTSQDLGGADSGLVQIAVGIMDSTDSWVDSYIEIYDFSISNEEKIDDASGSGIVEGLGVYSINTSQFEQGDAFGGFSASSAKTVKINFDGDSLDTDEGKFDVVASAAGTGSNAAGYQILLEGTEGKNKGKYAVFQTDSFGTVNKSKKSKSGWKNLTQAVKKGWETLFNTDLDKNSILEGDSSTSTSSSALTLFSSSKGAIEIKEGKNTNGKISYDSITGANVLSATPSKADFNSFSTSSSTYKVLVGGTGANAGKYQVWTADEEGVLTDKDETWYNGDQAASKGWENTFEMDFNSDGLISGDSIVKMLSESGPVVLKNIKGAALQVVNDYGYDIAASIANKKGSFDIVVEGTDGVYEDMWAIWTANSSGKVTSEGPWISTDDMIKSGLEKKYSLDFNDDGYTGVFDADVSGDTEGLGVALAEGKFAMITNGSTVSSITKGSKGKKFKVGKSWTLAAAETFSGVAGFNDGTYAVLKHKKNKKLKILNLDSNYKISGKALNFKKDTLNYYYAEQGFKVDFDGDNITASVASGTPSGSVALATMIPDSTNDKSFIAITDTITASGAKQLALDWSALATKEVTGSSYLDNVNLDTSGAYAKTQSLLVDQKGKTLTKKEGKYSFSDFAYNTTTDELAVIYTNGKKFKQYNYQWNGDTDSFDFDSTTKPVKAGTAAYFEMESLFGDLNDDGVKGDGQAIVNSTASGTLFKSASTKALSASATSTGTKIAFTVGSKGKAFKDKGSLSLKAVDFATDGTIDGLAVHKKGKFAKVYDFGSNGKLVKKGKSVKKNTVAFFDLETTFEYDLNGDGLIGTDVTKDGKLTEADLLAPVETKNAVTTAYDIAGTAYAVKDGSIDEVVLGKKLKKGYSVIGLESADTDGDGFYENYAMASNKKGTKFLMYSLGEGTSSSDGDWIFNDGIDSITKFKKKTVSTAESIFNQDFDKSGN